MSANNIDRRSFLTTTGVATVAGSTLAALPLASARAAGAGDRLRIGMIGVGIRGFGAHVKTLSAMQKAGANIEMVAIADVWTNQRDQVAAYIQEHNGNQPAKYNDYREMIEQEKLDAVCIATPDHWHAKQLIDCMNAGLHVYCEKPMTRTVEEAMEVVSAWRKSGQVVQIGVQSTSLPVIDFVGEHLRDGLIGKVLMFQTQYFRNSKIGQWRQYALTKDMNPKTIDWDLWLGTKEGLAEDVPFDREVYKQWRRFWPFGSGMYTDLFVHKVTGMLKATGLGYPGRIVGAGGIYLEYDGRDVPDVATIAADFPEGVHGLVSSTMCNEETPLQESVRGHYGTLVISMDGFEFIPERPQVTMNSQLKRKTYKAPTPSDISLGMEGLHFRNWLDAVEADDPSMCNNTPDLGAAAVTTVILGARSYREGRAFHFDPKQGVCDADSSWADRWEAMSKQRAKPKHIPGWTAGDYGSLLEDPAHMALGGPWENGLPPGGSETSGG